ncbi:MAG: hypothetical protein NTX03_03320 [Bacteroidetes bacterium]|nr:hypothetical protein [Bacteroidota bacterium]
MRHFFIFVLSIFLLSINVSCNKSSETASQSSKFFKTISTSKDEVGQYIFQHSDGGYVIFGIIDSLQNDRKHLLFIRTDAHGNLLQRKMFPTDIFEGAYIIKDPEGKFIVTHSQGRAIFKIDENGNLLFRTQHSPSPANMYFSAPYIDGNGNNYFSCSDGYYGIDNYCFLSQFAPTGAFIKDDFWQGVVAKWHIKILTFNIFNIDDKTGDKYFCGSCFPKPDWTKKDEEKIYELKVSKDSSVQVHIYNLQPTEYNYREVIQHLATRDDGLLILANTTPKNKDLGFIQIIKTDKGMNEVWNKYYQIHHTSSFANKLILLKDGNYLLCGFTQGTANTNAQPFIIKIDPNGNEIWEQIYPGTIAGEAIDCLEIEKDNLIILCNTNSFGMGKSGNDIFLFKTDKEGKL